MTLEPTNKEYLLYFFLNMTLHSLVIKYQCVGEPAASIFKVEV